MQEHWSSTLKVMNIACVRGSDCLTGRGADDVIIVRILVAAAIVLQHPLASRMTQEHRSSIRAR